MKDAKDVKELKCGFALRSNRKRNVSSSSNHSQSNENEDPDFFTENFEVET